MKELEKKNKDIEKEKEDFKNKYYTAIEQLAIIQNRLK